MKIIYRLLVIICFLVVTISCFSQSPLQPGSISYSGASIDPGTSAITIESTSNATGGNGTYNYQWQQSYDQNTWTDITGANTADLDPGRLKQRTYFRRKVTSGSQENTTGVAMVSVYDKMDPGQLYQLTGSIYNGQGPGLIQNRAPVAYGCSIPNIQWQLSFDNGSTWKDIIGA